MLTQVSNLVDARNAKKLARQGALKEGLREKSQITENPPNPVSSGSYSGNIGSIKENKTLTETGTMGSLFSTAQSHPVTAYTGIKSAEIGTMGSSYSSPGSLPVNTGNSEDTKSVKTGTMGSLFTSLLV